MDIRRLTVRSAAAPLLLAASWLIVSCDGATPPPVFPDLTVVTQALPAAAHGQPYEATVHAQGGDGEYVWAVTSGALPPGLALTVGAAGEAVISGVPTAAGVFPFTLTVQSGDGQSASAGFDLGVAFPELAIVTEALPAATERVAYQATVEAQGGDGVYQWSLTSGSLPPGLTLTTGAGGAAVISGVPQTAGDFAFTLRVQSGDGQSASRTLSIAVTPGVDELVIITRVLPPAAVGEPYQATVVADGGDGGYEWAITAGSLPPGLALSTGLEGEAVISGAPEATGEFEFTLRVQSDDGQSASRTFAMTIGDEFPDLVIVTETLPDGLLGETYSEAVHAAGGDGAYNWAVTTGALPPGLALTVDDLGEGEQAIISGVPEEAGAFTFTLTVTSGDGQTASRAFTITIQPAAPVVVETPAVPPALAGGPYDVGLKASGGDGQAYEWSLVGGSLPSGLSLTAAGRIQGTPAVADTAEFTVEVRSDGQSDSRSYRLAVVPNRPDEYNLTIFPVAEIPAGVMPHVEAAVAEWEVAITDNLPPVTIGTDFFGPEHCAGFGSLTNGTSVDDILIIVSIEPIDGPGGVLGRAGPCGLRGGTRLPSVGVLILDSDDLTPLIGNETLTFIISHELAHVMGFGTIWGILGLIEGAGQADPRFVGGLAVQEYNALGGVGMVPVENQGGPGTRDGHWRQTVFGNERMTGFSAPPGVFQPLSRVSIGSFFDMGYAVDMAAAHSFTLSAALRGGEEGPHDWGELGHDEILREPIRVHFPDGSTRTIQPD